MPRVSSGAGSVWPPAPAGGAAFASSTVSSAGRLSVAEWRAELVLVMRGLSAVFWGLPFALVAFARHFLALLPSVYDLVLPPLAAALVFVGLQRLTYFQRQERPWQSSLLATQIVALLTLGLAPFLYLWSRMPDIEFFARAVLLLLAVSLLFLVSVTRMLSRLAAMLPDDTVRSDARLFHSLATYVVLILGSVGVVLYYRMSPLPLTEFLSLPQQPLGFGRQATLLLLVLVPVAMTMSVTWKLKEVVMAIVASGGR